MSTLGLKLRELREQAGLSLRKAAMQTDIDVAILSKMERGERKFSKELVLKLAELYKANSDKLIIDYLSERVLYELEEDNLTKNFEYAVLTNEIYQAWSGMKASEYKNFKGIRKESLRDNMTDIEVALTDLGEIATRELAKKHRPYGLEENKKQKLQWGLATAKG